MPSHKQGTVNPVVTDSQLGKHGTSRMVTCFATSPIHSGEIDADSIRAQFQDLVLDGVVNDAGHTFGEFSRDYSEAPDYGDVETGGGGLPASPWVPNPVSPGEGVDYTKQAEAPDGYGTTPSDTWGVGVGSQENPKTSSEAISSHTLGDYGLGKHSPS